MGTVLTLPLFGVVLSHVVEAFDLRRWDHDGKLGRTASRFFRGERVKPESEYEILVAIGSAIFEAELLPPVLHIGAPVPEERRATPPGVILASILGMIFEQWDGLTGALRRASAPIGSARPAHVICLQLVTIDLAVRLTGLLWLMRSKVDQAPTIPWAVDGGVQARLRDLLATANISRAKLADQASVDEHSVDAWLDEGVRPTDENLQDLAAVLAGHGAGERRALIVELRRTYGLRDLWRKVIGTVGATHAHGMADRLTGYAFAMLSLVRQSRKDSAENDFKMNLAVTLGTPAAREFDLEFMEAMLRPLHREEPDPVWRTTLSAVFDSWLTYLQGVTARLGPREDAKLVEVFGKVSPDTREFLRYLSLASKYELARDPLVRAAMVAEVSKDGYFGALELKIRAIQMWEKGHILPAIEALREASRRDPLNAEIHFRLGALLWQIADVDEAFKELEIAVQLDPGWDRAHVEIAIILTNQDRNEEALRRLEAAIPQLREPSTWLLLHLGHVRERVGDDAGAEQAYEQVLSLEEDQAEALDHLAHLLLRRGEKRRGAELAKRANHLGFSDVFNAWSSKYYEAKGPRPRPPRTTPLHLVTLGDGAPLKPEPR